MRRALVLGAITIMGLASAPTNAQNWETWETDDSIAGGSHGDTIIQLPDGSLLNAFFQRDDSEWNTDDEWVVRWKPNHTDDWVEIDAWQKGGEFLETRPYNAASHLNEANDAIEVYVVGKAMSEVEITTGKRKKQQTSIQPVDNWAVRKGVLDLITQTWTWNTVRVFWSSIGPFNRATGVAVDTQGNVYVTGWTDDYWVTEVSYDGGVNWSESDRWRLDSDARSSGNGITIGPDGSVFVTGFGWEREIIPGTGRGRNRTPDTEINTAHWITRKMDPISGEWRVIDDYLGQNHGFAEVVHVTSDPNPILLVGGKSNVELGGFFGYWTLRASFDYGNTWQTVDEFQLLPDSGENRAKSITEGQDGTIYVGGTMDPDDINNSYTSGIRSSIDLLNWTTEEVFPPEWVNDSVYSPIKSILATVPEFDGGPSYLYVGESGPDQNGVLIRKLIP